MKATSISHPTYAVVSSITPTLISLPSVRQVPPPSSRPRPVGILDVPVTSPPSIPHPSTSNFVKNSLPFPALNSPPLAGPSFQTSTNHRSSPHSTRSNRKKKCWKPREVKPSCILVQDITLDRVLGLAEKSLVRIFFYDRMNMCQLTK
jgi:hypothetical protein